jgi:hypothetical protein
MYKKQWSDFETQSLAFGNLRKHLYPTYIVRGDVGEISIYRPTADTKNPELLLTLRVEASETPEASKFLQLSHLEDTYLLKGGDMAYKALELVQPLLK